ncbi:Ribosome-recycling factor [Thermodesulfobium narugense DSM 14796]|uniref:Ribosome-recycling factor n=1 Tax=Thermodesulfobium narugense DSM 14796 TaxID=747365 RepID=M1E991_9BACT|nr:ribosome recycling factor [Thermodesulfobium narugense]AEE14959.1 Ribosome-recycling factor [Thermodesulfobium narugense DSM 14796]
MNSKEIEHLRQRMSKAVDNLSKEFASVRTGRASPALLDHVKVDYYGTTVPIKQLANVSQQDARTLLINVYDKNALQAVDKAIRLSDLGLTPQVDGMVLRIVIPTLTQERRKELVKVVKKMAEEARVAVRNIRRDELEILEKRAKNKEISEDDLKRFKNEFQKITDSYIQEIDKLLSNKEKEILND